MQDFPTKTDGTSTEPAAEYNNLTAEMKTMLSSLSIAFSSGSVIQLAQSVATIAQIGGYYTDGGSADTYVLTTAPSSRKNSPTYYEGMRIYFFAANTNTGASTINLSGLGASDAVDRDGNPLTGGEIEAGKLSEFVRDGSGDFRYVEPISVTDQNDKIKISAADTTTGFGADKFVASDGLTLTKLNPAGNEQLEYKVGADQIKDSMIDWGSGAGQVDSDDIPAGTTNLWGNTWSYDSGWFSLNVSTGSTKAHGISLSFPADPLEILVFWRASSGGSYIGLVGFSFENSVGNPYISHDGTNIYIIGDTTFGYIIDSSYSTSQMGNGELRFLARKAV